MLKTILFLISLYMVAFVERFAVGVAKFGRVANFGSNER